jgi:hypothetical protein
MRAAGAWLAIAPELHGVSAEEAAEHVFINNVQRTQFPDGKTSYVVAYLVYSNWAIISSSTVANVEEGYSDLELEAAFLENEANLHEIPSNIAPLHDAMEAMADCHPEAVFDVCNMHLKNSATPGRAVIVQTQYVTLNFDANECLGAGVCLGSDGVLDTACAPTWCWMR